LTTLAANRRNRDLATTANRRFPEYLPSNFGDGSQFASSNSPAGKAARLWNPQRPSFAVRWRGPQAVGHRLALSKSISALNPRKP